METIKEEELEKKMQRKDCKSHERMRNLCITETIGKGFQDMSVQGLLMW